MNTIFWFNPYKQTVRIPDAKITVPGIKTLEDAKRFVETEDFDNFRFIVKSKTGKPYPFKDVAEAKDFAQKKSTKSVCYTVWNDGDPITSFVNKKELTKWNTVFIKLYDDKPDRNKWYCSTSKGQFAKTTWSYGAKIDVAPGKVRLQRIYIEWIKCVNGHLATKFHNISITFHKDGSVYLYNGRIQHVSANELVTSYDDDVLSALKDELTKLRPELKKMISEAGTYSLCGVFSRPTAYYKFDTFHHTATKRYCPFYFGNYPKEIVDESKLIDVIAKRMHIPTSKTLRKLYNENIHNMEVVHFLKFIGFKDVNSYQKLTGFGVHFSRRNPAEFAAFFKKFIKLRGENNVVRMTSDTDFNLIDDVAMSYNEIVEEASEFVLNKCRNFEEIHETFNRSCATRENLVDEKIPYSKTEKKKYEFISENGIRFELAEGRKDLAIIGANMGICVGGYGDKAVNKHCVIVKMMDGDDYAACIEVQKQGVVQLKAKYNNPVRSKYRADIDAWLENGEIKCECYDYNCIGEDWNSTCRYDQIRPDDFEPTDHEPILQIVKAKHEKYVHNNKWFTKDEANRLERIQELATSAEPHRFEDFEFEAIETDELPF